MNAREIAASFGLHRAGREWRGRCPACGYADTFAVTERQGRVLACCMSCQDKQAIGRLLRDAGARPARPGAEIRARSGEAAAAQRTARALAIWTASEPAAGTLADRYLTARGLPGLAASFALRFRPDCPHPTGGKLPAMVALVQAADGSPIAVHRTFLARDGSGKAMVEPTKATLGAVAGGAVRLDPIAPELAIAEGIESAASAGRLLGLPAWAAVSAGNLARGLVLPPEVRAVVIAADNDAPDEHGRRPGPDAAREALRRWKSEGRRVRVALPRGAGRDFNDLILEAA